MPSVKAFLQQVKGYILCSICRTPLLSLAEMDAWGNRYCVRHSKELSRCTCCQRLVCDALTQGGVAYKDNRVVCNLCRKTAIDTKEQAKPYVEAAAAWLFKKGLVFQNLKLHFDLVYLDQLISSVKPRYGTPQGMIYQSTSGRVRMVNGVAILKGLSRQVLSGVVTHELGHAWLFVCGVDGLPLPIEEGFCNTLSYLYHSEFNTDEAKFCKRVIKRSPDPVYGDGFRQVYASVQKHSFQSVVSNLQKYHKLP